MINDPSTKQSSALKDKSDKSEKSDKRSKNIPKEEEMR